MFNSLNTLPYSVSSSVGTFLLHLKDFFHGLEGDKDVKKYLLWDLNVKA